ncbi:MAG: DUF86 domain-containing protein [Candidatus Parvarchaeota archaeon]|jgi:hypothetical protein|nr:DUF86 domain-containing protein [Candidatus Parvarchaeota archaeon]
MREQEVYISEIYNALKRASDQLKNVSLDAFMDSRDKQDIVIRNLEIAGEAVNQLLNHFPDMKANSKINWSDLIALRNIIAHQYFRIDYEVIYKIVVETLPSLIPEIKKLLPKT